MHGKMRDRLRRDPLEHRLAGLGERTSPDTAQPKAPDDLVLDRRPLVQTGVDHPGRIDGHLYLAHEVWITLAHQHAENMGMGVGEMLAPHDVGVRIDPEDAQLAASAIVKISDRREINQTIPANRDDAFRRVAVDGGTRRSDLRKKRRSADDARIGLECRPALGSGTSIVSSGPSAGGARKARSSAPKR